jgi:hypothetical protein
MRGIRAETSGVHRRSARETVRASRPKMDRTFPGVKSKNSFLDRKKFEVCQIDERYFL